MKLVIELMVLLAVLTINANISQLISPLNSGSALFRRTFTDIRPQNEYILPPNESKFSQEK